MCFGGVAVERNTVFQSLKGKVFLRINKIWVQNFPRYGKVRFYPWKVTIPYFSVANDRMEIDNFCCLVS